MLHRPVPYCSMAGSTAAAHVLETCFCATTVDYSFSNMQCRQVLNARYKWGKTKRQSDPCLGIGISATFFRSSKMTPNVPIAGCVPAFLVEKNLFERVQNSRIKNKGKGDCDNLSNPKAVGTSTVRLLPTQRQSGAKAKRRGKA